MKDEMTSRNWRLRGTPLDRQVAGFESHLDENRIYQARRSSIKGVALAAISCLVTMFAASPAAAGAWGIGAFENDDAMDWMSELERSATADFLGAALRSIDAKSKYVEAPECSNAMAAAEVIAAARGRPSKGLPAEAAEWLKRVRPAVGSDLVSQAHAAVSFCRDNPNSELRQLWAESKDFQAWLAGMANLLSRLK